MILKARDTVRNKKKEFLPSTNVVALEALFVLRGDWSRSICGGQWTVRSRRTLAC
jgi:hypothetical protein